MAITYKFTRVEPLIDSNNNVIRWIVGMTANDDTNNLSAYIDAEVPVSENNIKPLANWSNDEIKTFCQDYATSQDWQTKLADMINAQIQAPKLGPSIDTSNW